MNIDGIFPVPETPENARLKKASEVKPATGTETGSVHGSSDEVSISNRAKAAYSESHLVKLVQQMPDVRPEVVEKARQDIASGRLFSQDIAEKTAEEILRRI